MGEKPCEPVEKPPARGVRDSRDEPKKKGSGFRSPGQQWNGHRAC
jgi:hypothetical protein